MKRPRIHPNYIALGLAVSIFVVLAGLRHFGMLQKLELMIYDKALQLRHDPKAVDDRIVIIGIDETDIRRHDYPLRDAQLAALLTKVLAANPFAIGMDLYRDLPEPRDGSELEELNKVLGPADNLSVIYIPERNGDPNTGVPPPPILAKLPKDERQQRVSVNDLPADGNTVRRGYLSLDDANHESCPSLALQVALTALSWVTQARNLPPPAIEYGPQASWMKLGKARFERFHKRDSGYAVADDGGFQILLDFKSPSEFRTVSLGEVLDPKFSTKLFTDRVVLIGNVAQSFKDQIDTPLNPKYPGVKMHAQVINQIMRDVLDGDPPMRVWPHWTKNPWALLWAVLGGLAGLTIFRSPWLGALVVAGGALGLVAVEWFTFRHNWWLPFTEPSLDYLATAISTLGLVFLRERQERAQLMQLFSRHVSGKVAQTLWEQRHLFYDGKRPLSLKVTATVLFSDFVGFSSVSEKMDATALMDWLNESMEHLAQQVEAHGGIVNKYIGDSVMALFGVPVPSAVPEEIARDAANAVRCALAMGADLDALNVGWKAAGSPEIGMRIGIFTGPLVSGSMGSAERHEFTVIGDSVNTASRLESTRKDEILAPPGRSCRILIGESTHALLDSRFETEYVGEEYLKGKENKVSVYRVLGEKPAASEHHRQFTPSSP